MATNKKHNVTLKNEVVIELPTETRRFIEHEGQVLWDGKHKFPDATMIERPFSSKKGSDSLYRIWSKLNRIIKIYGGLGFEGLSEDDGIAVNNCIKDRQMREHLVAVA